MDLIKTLNVHNVFTFTVNVTRICWNKFIKKTYLVYSWSEKPSNITVLLRLHIYYKVWQCLLLQQAQSEAEQQKAGEWLVCPPLKPVQPFTFNKTVKSSVLLQLSKLWPFLFFQQIPKPQNWWVLIGRWPTWPIVSVVASVFPYSPLLTLVLLACWKSACAGIIGSCCILSGTSVSNSFIKGIDYGKII